MTALRRVGETPGLFVAEISVAGERRVVDVHVDRTETASASPLTCTGPTGQRVPRYELVSITDRQ